MAERLLDEVSSTLTMISAAHAELPCLDSAFLVQQCSLVIAPVFFSAAVYGLFGAIIPRIDVKASPLKPKLYSIIFIIIDVATLAVQGAGGAMAGIALGNNEESETGTHIFVGGIAAQVCSLGIDFLALG